MMKKEALKAGILNALHGVDPKTATPQQLHQALGETVMEAIAPDWKKSMDAHEHSRRACYFSMEFLVGRAVYNNLLVLDVMQEAEEAFAELGVSLSDLEVIEDAALGNAVWADWLHAFWTVRQHWICRWTAMAFAISMVCSSSTSRTAARRKCRMIGCVTVMRGLSVGKKMPCW